MTLFSPENNKRRNRFEQGINGIRRQNSNFFDNAKAVNSIYDRKDINSYFTIEYLPSGMELQFRETMPLPENIAQDIRVLFEQCFQAEVQE